MGVLYAKVGGTFVPIAQSGPQGPSGGPVPVGGALGDLIIKNGAPDFAVRWGYDPPKLHVPSTYAPSLASTPALGDPLVIGPTNADNLVVYRTGMMCRTNGAAQTLRLNYYGGEVSIHGGDAQQFPRGLAIAESIHATSRRARIGIGSGWEIGQDFVGNGIKDFFLYDATSGTPFRAYPGGKVFNLGVPGTIDLYLATTTSTPNLATAPRISSDANFINLHGKTDLYLDGNTIFFRNAAYTALATFDGSRALFNKRIQIDATRPSYSWGDAGILIYETATNNQAAGIALHSPNVAPQLRAQGVLGSKIGCVNESMTGFVPLQASAFEVNSTITAKRDVRSVRGYEPIVGVQDPAADVVPPIDVMALRPVAFRPKVGALRIEPVEGESYTPNPATHRIVDEVGILGHEGRRERLGLVAEEVERVLPSAVTHDMFGNCVGIDYAQVAVALLDHIQQLTRRIEILELEGHMQ